MMGDFLGGSGQNSAVMQAIQKKMILEAFGIKDETEPLLDEPLAIGEQTENGWPGVLAVRVVPASAMNPQARCVMLTTGELKIRPRDIKRVAEFFSGIADQVEEAYEKAKAEEKQQGYTSLFSGALINSME